MREDLITYKTAKIAKEKGFNIECYNYYGIISGGLNVVTGEDIFEAPTQSLLHKWLRKKHGLFIEIFLTSEGNYTINSIVIIGKSEYSVDFKLFDEYEDALEEGLYQALLLI